MHIRIIRQEYNLLLSNIAEELDKLRKLTFWGECTSEAVPLEKLHKKSEADINTHLQTIFAALFIPPRLGRKQKIAKACEELSLSFNELDLACNGWSFNNLGKIQLIIEQITNLVSKA